MAPTSSRRGHTIALINGRWCYADNGGPAEQERACARCGMPPTKEGHDFCLGTIPGLESACCGHGLAMPFAVMKGAGGGLH